MIVNDDSELVGLNGLVLDQRALEKDDGMND